ncbi:unnamed protein product [Owenia fusiformis]|uniref:Uncharacterized protein n=1 Tax=Owenia fusiformis TaxID=6347 RepID=A0A8J1Y872_OWEFU|nr:unnamed protein product [Owenia fusiformis]
MNTDELDHYLLPHSAYRISKILMLYVPPVLLVIGTFGNIFAFIILKRLPTQSTYFYLSVLSITDLVVLYIGQLRKWIGVLNGNDLRNHHDWICKLTVVFGYVSSDFSVWLIIAVTVERYIVVCHPLKANRMCNIKRARFVSLLIFTIILAINSQFFVTVKLIHHVSDKDNKTHWLCESDEPYKFLNDVAWSWVDAAIYSFVPFFAIMVLNLLIISAVLRAQTSRNQIARSASMYKAEVRVKKHRQEANTRLTVMMLTVSFTFLLTTLPNACTGIAINLFTDKSNTDLVIKYHLVRTITDLLMYLNHSINFYLYCATGAKFRKQITKLLSCGFPQNFFLSSTGGCDAHPNGNDVRCSSLLQKNNTSIRTLLTHTNGSAPPICKNNRTICAKALSPSKWQLLRKQKTKIIHMYESNPQQNKNVPIVYKYNSMENGNSVIRNKNVKTSSESSI